MVTSIYIVTCQSNNTTWEKIFKNGFNTLEGAQNFIVSTTTKVEKLDDFRYKDKKHMYRIYEIQVMNGWNDSIKNIKLCL